MSWFYLLALVKLLPTCIVLISDYSVTELWEFIYSFIVTVTSNKYQHHVFLGFSRFSESIGWYSVYKQTMQLCLPKS